MIVEIKGMPLEILHNEFKGRDGNTVAYDDLIFYEFGRKYADVYKIRVTPDDFEEIVGCLCSESVMRCDCETRNGQMKFRFVGIETL